MLLYNPVDGDVSSRPIRYRPKTCFVMTKLGKPLPAEIKKIRKRAYLISRSAKVKSRIKALLKQHSFDAYTSSICNQVIKY